MARRAIRLSAFLVARKFVRLNACVTSKRRSLNAVQQGLAPFAAGAYHRQALRQRRSGAALFRPRIWLAGSRADRGVDDFAKNCYYAHWRDAKGRNANKKASENKHVDGGLLEIEGASVE